MQYRTVVSPPGFLVLLLLACALAGCRDARPTRVPVSGKVLIDGKPLMVGYIRFVPADARPSGGEIGPDGRFSLTCYDGQDGAVIGTHRVEVAASETLGANALRWHAPKKYLRADIFGLTVEITEPTDSLVIDLTWNGSAPFIEQFGTEPGLGETPD